MNLSFYSNSAVVKTMIKIQIILGLKQYHNTRTAKSISESLGSLYTFTTVSSDLKEGLKFYAMSICRKKIKLVYTPQQEGNCYTMRMEYQQLVVVK